MANLSYVLFQNTCCRNLGNSFHDVWILLLTSLYRCISLEVHSTIYLYLPAICHKTILPKLLFLRLAAPFLSPSALSLFGKSYHKSLSLPSFRFHFLLLLPFPCTILCLFFPNLLQFTSHFGFPKYIFPQLMFLLPCCKWTCSWALCFML